MKSDNRNQHDEVSCGAAACRIIDAGDGTSWGEILLVKQFPNKDKWGLPKGHINEGEETFAQCAVREVLEETGVNVQLISRLQDVEVTTFNGRRKLVKTWFARPVGDAVPDHRGTNSEVADARWFNIDDVPTLITYQRPVIEKAIHILRTIMHNNVVQ